jgi:C4-dicarboxylate-specific signal transduction histidine kinase
MIPEITHPLVFGLFAAELASFVVFVHQAAINALLYRGTRRPELRTNAAWCFWSAVLTTCYLVMYVRLPVAVYEQSFHWISISASFAMRYYLAAVGAYLGSTTRWLRVMIAWQPVVAVWPLASSVAQLLGGDGFFLRTRDVPPSGMLLQIVDAMAPRNEVYSAFHLMVVSTVLLDMVALWMAIWTAKRRDPWITLGVTVTCLAIAFEATAMRYAWRYAIPTTFAAKLIETLRITYVSTLNAGREVAQLGHQVERQRDTIRAQLDELTAGAELRRLGEQTLEVGHEMRNPIASATLFVRAAKEAEAQQKPVTPLLDKTEAALAQLSHLLVHVAKRPEPAPANEVTSTRLGHAMHEAVALCAARIERTGARVEVSVPHDCLIDARPAALTQVFVNLVTNACDAVEGSRDPHVLLEAAPGTERIEVRVRDSGARPSEPLARAMWKPGFTTKKLQGGQGLGLNITQRVLLELGGTITLDASSASTCFVVSLPAAVVAAGGAAGGGVGSEQPRDQAGA